MNGEWIKLDFKSELQLLHKSIAPKLNQSFSQNDDKIIYLKNERNESCWIYVVP